MNVDREIKAAVVMFGFIMLYWVNIGGPFRMRHFRSANSTFYVQWFN